MWDGNEAAKYAHEHAARHSLGKCAHYVSEAIRHGGIKIPNTHYAKDMGKNLTLFGFRPVQGSPIAGDVAVIQPISGHPYGHACIYDGNKWVSDFVQSTMYPGHSYRAIRPNYIIYRHI